ncbi:ankyrin repeat domain-containing protein [Thauera sinica]|uniref:Ankyrin repeat domain-containing protein n=1 Tax=Thauera sinica TaxID=2665146 RepID=A0ABW1AN44_9RHOO|nr:ankyrin repeat domain-containing protein [Thauera sp. K11]ATE60509.1 hypothetical protein CCZ27_11630 [Thauera sp. K11]
MLPAVCAHALDVPTEFAGFQPAERPRVAQRLTPPERFAEISRTASDWLPIAPDADDLALLEAARRADWAEVAKLVKAGANPNVTDEMRRARVLPLAAAAGELEVVRQLLAAGASLDVRGEHGLTPLGAAILRGHLQVVRLLLREGADIERTSADGNTPLMEAAVLDRVDVAEVLLAAGADPLRLNREGHHALTLAAASGSVKVIGFLLGQGMDPETPDRRLQSPLYWAMHQGQDAAMAMLMAAGAQYANMAPTMRR